MLELADAARDLPLVVVGDGRLRGRLPASARVVGFVAPAEVGSYLERAAVVVCPSRREGYGIVARQALAHGRPVVASRVGGLPEVIQDERGQTARRCGRPRQDLLTLWTQTRCTAKNAQREARSRRRVGAPGETLQPSEGRFWQQPEGNERLGPPLCVVLLAKTPGLRFVVRLDWRPMPLVRVCAHSVNRP